MAKMSIYIAHTTWKNEPGKHRLHILESCDSQLAAVKYFRKYGEGRIITIDSPYYIADFQGAAAQQQILTALADDSTRRIAVLLAEDHVAITSVYLCTTREGLQLVMACNDGVWPAESQDSSSLC